MSSIKPTDSKVIDQLFEQKGNRGYVLDFSNPTFARFFEAEFGIDIYATAYSAYGPSKMNRLRCFLQQADDKTAINVLQQLWEYRQTVEAEYLNDSTGISADEKFSQLINRLGGKAKASLATQPPPPRQNADPAKIAQLMQELIALSSLPPHPRGFAFEKFLKALFDAYHLEARDAFRIKGEQIDGSFQLSGLTYLVEAKWQNPLTGATDLHSFEGKLGEKARWARGLFISQSGFTEDGLHAFGRAKSTICMDGLDLYDALHRGLSLADVLERKARRAAETGAPFVRVRDLYPN